MRATRTVLAAGLVTVLLLAFLPLASADPVCTGYRGNGTTKSRTCVDATNHNCILWSDGWVGSSPFYYCAVPASTGAIGDCGNIGPFEYCLV
ncbi:MAG: hypothetical protein ACT4PT_09705 [Methanobacteriota archaeon]